MKSSVTPAARLIPSEMKLIQPNSFPAPGVLLIARIQVPLFIDVGDVVRVDTRSGEYVSRA